MHYNTVVLTTRVRLFEKNKLQKELISQPES